MHKLDQLFQDIEKFEESFIGNRTLTAKISEGKRTDDYHIQLWFSCKNEESGSEIEFVDWETIPNPASQEDIDKAKSSLYTKFLRSIILR